MLAGERPAEVASRLADSLMPGHPNLVATKARPVLNQGLLEFCRRLVASRTLPSSWATIPGMVRLRCRTGQISRGQMISATRPVACSISVCSIEEANSGEDRGGRVRVRGAGDGGGLRRPGEPGGGGGDRRGARGGAAV